MMINDIKNFFIFLIILWNEKIIGNNLDTITIVKNCVFNDTVFIGKECTINNLMINGQILFFDINQLRNININFNNQNNSEFLIYSIPIIVNPIDITNSMLISIDNNNKLYLESKNIPTIEHFITNGDTLNTTNIATLDINQTNNSLPLISSKNKDGLPINIKFGNNNNNIIFLSQPLLSVNNIIFNNTINYSIGTSNNTDVNMNNDITVGELFINKNFIKNNNVTLSFQDFIVDSNLNINSNNSVLIQGNITFNNDIIIGDNITNLTLYTEKNDTITPVSFLGIDKNQNLCITDQWPALATLNTNQIKSYNNNLNIISINNNISIGNLNSNIIINAERLLLENDYQIDERKNNINFIFNNKNTFTSEVTFNTLNNAFYIIPNNILSMNGNIKFNAVTFNKDIYFPNLPIIDNFFGYIVISYSDNIGYLSVLPITNNSKKLKTIDTEFHSVNQEIYKKLKIIENELKNYTKEYAELKKSYIFLTKQNRQNKKKILFYLKFKKKYKHFFNKNIERKLHTLQEDLL